MVARRSRAAPIPDALRRRFTERHQFPRLAADRGPGHRRASVEGDAGRHVACLRACYEKHPTEADFITAVAYNFMLPFEIRDAIGGWATDPELVRQAF